MVVMSPRSSNTSPVSSKRRYGVLTSDLSSTAADTTLPSFRHYPDPATRHVNHPAQGLDRLIAMSAPPAGSAAADLQPQLDPTHLAVVRYPSDWQPPATVADGFFAMIRGEHEVTVVAPEVLLDEAAWGERAEQVDRAW